MEQKDKQCWNCSNFHAYYTQGFCCLVRENNGYCSHCKKIMQRTDGCDQWHFHFTAKVRRLNLALNAIPEIYKTVAAIEQILQEESELQKLSNE